MNNIENKPLVSIVMATFNGERFIKQQLESLLAQTYANIEIIITDDASTDNTMGIINSYALDYKFIKIFRNTTNIGYIKNFEKGIELSNGTYIAPCDQDDIWEHSKIEILVRELQQNVIVYSDSALIDENGNKIGKNLSDIKRLATFDNCLSYAIGGSVPGHAMLIKKSVIDCALPFPTIIPHDYLLGFVATFLGVIKLYDKPLVLYRQHTQNVFGLRETQAKRTEKKKQSRLEKNTQIRQRMQFLYEKCPNHLPQKKVYYRLCKSYQNFSLRNNFLRMIIFFQYRNTILAYKKRTAFQKLLFCLKMFAKIE